VIATDTMVLANSHASGLGTRKTATYLYAIHYELDIIVASMVMIGWCEMDVPSHVTFVKGGTKY